MATSNSQVESYTSVQIVFSPDSGIRIVCYISRHDCTNFFSPQINWILALRVVESRCVFRIVQLMGCELEDYRARMGTWAPRTSWRTAQGQDSSGQAINYIGNMLLCAVALNVLLVVGGVEQNP
jgi:hypothetical protein